MDSSGKIFRVSSHPKVSGKASRQISENSAFLRPERGWHNATCPREDAQDHDFVSCDQIQKLFDQKELQRK